jgi:hypothetical protein
MGIENPRSRRIGHPPSSPKTTAAHDVALPSLGRNLPGQRVADACLHAAALIIPQEVQRTQGWTGGQGYVPTPASSNKWGMGARSQHPGLSGVIEDLKEAGDFGGLRELEDRIVMRRARFEHALPSTPLFGDPG